MSNWALRRGAVWYSLFEGLLREWALGIRGMRQRSTFSAQRPKGAADRPGLVLDAELGGRGGRSGPRDWKGAGCASRDRRRFRAQRQRGRLPWPGRRRGIAGLRAEPFRGAALRRRRAV